MTPVIRRSGFLALLWLIRVGAWAVMLALHGLWVGSLVLLMVRGRLIPCLAAAAPLLGYALWFGRDNETRFNNVLECFYSKALRMSLFMGGLAVALSGSYDVLSTEAIEREADRRRVQDLIVAIAVKVEVVGSGVGEAQRKIVGLRSSLVSPAEPSIREESLAATESTLRNEQEVLQASSESASRLEHELRALEPDIARAPPEAVLVPRESALTACRAVQIQIIAAQSMHSEARRLAEAYREVRSALVAVRMAQERIAQEIAAADVLERDSKDLLRVPPDQLDDARLEQLVESVLAKITAISPLAENAARAPQRAEPELGDLSMPSALRREAEELRRRAPKELPAQWETLLQRLNSVRYSLRDHSGSGEAGYRRTELLRCVQDVRVVNREMQTWLDARRSYASSLDHVAELRKTLESIPGLPLEQRAEAILKTIPALQRFADLFRALRNGEDVSWASWRLDEAHMCAKRWIGLERMARRSALASGAETREAEAMAELRRSESLLREARSADEARKTEPAPYANEKPALDDLLRKICINLEKTTSDVERDAELARAVAVPAIEAGRELESEIVLDVTVRELARIKDGTRWGAWENKPLVQAEERLQARRKEVLSSGRAARSSLQATLASLRALLGMLDAWSAMSQAFERGWPGNDLWLVHDRAGEPVTLSALRARLVTRHESTKDLVEGDLGRREKQLCDNADARVREVCHAVDGERQKLIVVTLLSVSTLTAMVGLLIMWVRRSLQRARLRRLAALDRHVQLPGLLVYALNKDEKLYIREEAVSRIGAMGLRAEPDYKAILDAFDTLTMRENERVEWRVRAAIHRVLEQMDRRKAREA